MTFLNLGCGKRRSTRTVMVLAILLAMTSPTRSLRLARAELASAWAGAAEGVLESAIGKFKPPYCARRRCGFQFGRYHGGACAGGLVFPAARWPAAGAS